MSYYLDEILVLGYSYLGQLSKTETKNILEIRHLKRYLTRGNRDFSHIYFWSFFYPIKLMLLYVWQKLNYDFLARTEDYLRLGLLTQFNVWSCVNLITEFLQIPMPTHTP